jgi:hypothetical protein
MSGIQGRVDSLCTILVTQPPNFTKIKQAALEVWNACASHGERVSADQAEQLSKAFAKLFQNKNLAPAVRHEAAQAVSYVLDFDAAAGSFRESLLHTCVPEQLVAQAHMDMFNHQAKDSNGLLQQRSAHTIRLLATLASPAEREVRPARAASCWMSGTPDLIARI